MKKFLFIALIPSILYAEGPLFRHKEPEKQQEFENAYKDIRSKVASSSGTLTTPTISSPTISSPIITGSTCIDSPTLCVDSVNHRVGISTSAPSSKFHVSNNGSANTFFLDVDNTANTQEVLFLRSTGSGPLMEIRAGSTLSGATARFTMTQAGEITQPLQPSFLATDGTGAANVTGDGTTYSELWPTEVFDQGSDFASNTFTAPVTGKYFLSATVELTDLLVGHSLRIITLTTSNRNYVTGESEALAQAAIILTVNAVADMDVNDTATVTVRVTNSTKTVSVPGGATVNFFSGSLIN